MSGARSRNLFIGNVPFEQTEEQLYDIFSTVGQVVGLRLVFDHSGKPKGFGFCEYRDPETAAAALRNLQGYEVGGRALRLDFADDDPGAKRDRGGVGAGVGSSAPPKPLPMGTPLPPGASATDNISSTLATMPPAQLLSIMSQMKALVTTSPNEAKALLSSQPQLAYALFQAMLMMGLVDPSVLARVVQQGGAPAPQPASAIPPAMAAGGRSGYGTPPPFSGPPPSAPPQQPMYGQTPPTGPRGGGMMPQAPPPASAGAPPDQTALIAQVLAMTDEQINSLDPQSRATILQIRAQAAGAMRR